MPWFASSHPDFIAVSLSAMDATMPILESGHWRGADGLPAVATRTNSVLRDSKKSAQSTLALECGCPQLSKRSWKTAEVVLTENDSVSMTYEFRTKSE